MPKAVQEIEIKEIKTTKIEVPIVGTSPLIVHRFNEKVKKQLLDRQQGRKPPKEIKDPDQEYKDSIYYLSDGSHGFPAMAIKAAMVRAGKMEGLIMSDLRQMFFVHGQERADGLDLVRIKGKPRMREDGVRVGAGPGGGRNDLRYRAEYPTWEATPIIQYNQNVIAADAIINLLNAAGFSVGICEWRPEKNGDFGRFEVKTGKKRRARSN